MSPAIKRKLKQQSIQQIKQAVASLGYSENRHGKWVNETGTVRWEFGANNLKRQHKAGGRSTTYYTTPASWVNVRSVPYSWVKVDVGNDGRPKLIIDKNYNYGHVQ